MESVQGPSDHREEFTVVVSVGTDHHPFDRLIQWIDQWAAFHPELTVFAQRGTAEAPSVVTSTEIVAHGQLLRLFTEASVVVSHGGPSTVMDARASGHLPIVVPRDPKRGEHVDAHQMRFADHLELHGLARLAGSESELFQLLDVSLESPAAFAIDRTEDDAPSGVVEFGAVVDGLLGVSTPIGTDPR